MTKDDDLLDVANRMIERDVEEGDDEEVNYWEIPEKKILNLDFYRLIFLNLKNDQEFNAPLIQVIVAFQRLSIALQLDGIAKEYIREFSKSKTVSWEAFNDTLVACKNEIRSDKFLNLSHSTIIPLSTSERIYQTLNDSGSSWWCDLISFFRGFVILFASIALILESLSQFKEAPCLNCEPVHYTVFRQIEIVTIMVFTIDYLVRVLLVGFCRIEVLDEQVLLAISTGKKSNLPKGVIARVWSFATQFLSIIDLVSILPFYIEIGLLASGRNPGDFGEIRIVRLVALLRILRIKHFREMENILTKSLIQSGSALSILVFVFSIVILIFSVIGYYLEGGTWVPAGEEVNGTVIKTSGYYRPQDVDTSVLEISPFTSIPAAMWWAVITATTVGYGDMHPTTPWGKFLGSILAIVGIVILAMPIAVIGSNFTNEFGKFFAIKNQLAALKHEQHHIQLFAKCVDKVPHTSKDEDDVDEKHPLIESR